MSKSPENSQQAYEDNKLETQETDQAANKKRIVYAVENMGHQGNSRERADLEIAIESGDFETDYVWRHFKASEYWPSNLSTSRFGEDPSDSLMEKLSELTQKLDDTLKNIEIECEKNGFLRSEWINSYILKVEKKIVLDKMANEKGMEHGEQKSVSDWFLPLYETILKILEELPKHEQTQRDHGEAHSENEEIIEQRIAISRASVFSAAYALGKILKIENQIVDNGFEEMYQKDQQAKSKQFENLLQMWK